MKVLLSAFACEPNRGSEQGVGWNWGVSLARSGVEVVVLTRSEGKAAIERELDKIGLCNLQFHYVDPPARLHLIRRGRLRVYAEYLLWQRQAVVAARRLCEHEDIDIVHHVTWGSLNAGSFMWKLGKPFIFGPVGGGQTAPHAFARYIEGYWRFEFVRSIYVKWVVRWRYHIRKTVQAAAVVLAANEDTRRQAVCLKARRVEMMSDVGISADFFAHSTHSNSENKLLRVLWVGRLLPTKGIRLALEAFRYVRIPFRLTIIGDGPGRRNLESYIEKYNLERVVDWRGAVDWCEIRQIYREQDVFLFTSLRDTTGIQLLEAMASGLPIITLDHHGAGYLVPDSAGVKVPVTTVSETIDGLARAICGLAVSPARRQKMGRAALETAWLHSWDEKAARMVNVYHDLLAHVQKGIDTASTCPQSGHRIPDHTAVPPQVL